jgi:hypothetical protein
VIPPVHLMYLTFGDDPTAHHQANFSILTFLSDAPTVTTVNVFTDSPRHYRHLGSRATIHPIDRAQLDEWMGAHRFFWRVKIKAIESLAAIHPGESVLYVDSDTFLIGGVSELATELANGRAIMHEVEGRLSEMKQKTTQRMWRQVRGRTFGGIRLDDEVEWNAGVVGVPAKDRGEVIRLALAICDDMSAAGVTPRLIEQHALSVALEHVYGLRSALPWIEHYWGNKEEWNRAIEQFFAGAALEDLGFEEKLAKVRAFDYQELPIRKIRRKGNERVRRIADVLLPPRGLLYRRGREGKGPGGS